MTENDYVILVDENGTPYIAHGERYQRFKNNLKNSRAVKYLARFPNFYGMGKTAYAYTEQQLRNLRNGGRKAANTVKNTAKKAAKYVDDHDAGLTEAIGARVAQRRVDRANRRGDTETAEKNARKAYRLREQSRREYNKSGVKKAADTINKYGATSMNAVRGAGRAATEKAGNAARRVGRFIDDHDAGLTEAIEARSARRKKNRAIKTGDTQGISAYSAQEARLREQSRKERGEAIEGVKNTGKSAVSAAKNIGGQVSGQIKNVQSTIDNKLDQIKAGRIAKQHERRLAEIKDYMDDIAEAKQAFENGDPKALRELENAVNSVSDRLGGVQTVLTKSDLSAIEGFLDGIEEYLDRGYDAEDRRGNIH